MSYATQDDLLARYSLASLLLIASSEADATQLDTAKVGRAIGDAEAIVDLSVRARYAVPLSPVPPEIVGIVCALARYALYERATNIPDRVKDGRTNAMAVLSAIRDGDVPLTAAPVAPADAATIEALPELDSDGPVFTSDSLKGW